MSSKETDSTEIHVIGPEKAVRLESARNQFRRALVVLANVEPLTTLVPSLEGILPFLNAVSLNMLTEASIRGIVIASQSDRGEPTYGQAETINAVQFADSCLLSPIAPFQHRVLLNLDTGETVVTEEALRKEP